MKHLKPCGVARGLVAENIAGAEIERQSSFRQWPATRHRGIGGVARGRNKGHVGGRKMLAPIVAAAGPFRQIQRGGLVASKTVNRSAQMGKGFKIPGLFQGAPRDDGWKTRRLCAVGGAYASDRL